MGLQRRGLGNEAAQTVTERFPDVGREQQKTIPDPALDLLEGPAEPSPTSPVVDISPYGATTGRSNFPLHLRSDYFFGEFHSEIIEQNLLMV